jgi:hypothetical protein
MNLYFLLAVSLVDIFLLSPLQPNAIDSKMEPPAVLSVAYRPTGEVIARGAFGEITDLDLFLFMNIRGDSEDDLLRMGNYFSSRASFSEVDPEDTVWIREKVEDLVIVYYLASLNAPPPEQEAGIETTGQMRDFLKRLLTYPASGLVWIDNEVVPKIKIEQADIISYYRSNIEDFKQTGEFDVQYIFVQTPVSETEAQRREIITYLERLRDQLTDVESWQEQIKILDRRPDISASYNRKIFIIDDEPDNTVEKNILGLRKGQFTPIFETIEGFYLGQCIEAEPPVTITLPEAEAEIRQTLQAKFIGNQYDIDIERLKTKTSFLLYVDRWKFLPPDGPVIALGKFRLPRSEVDLAMGERIYQNEEILDPILTSFVEGILDREIVYAHGEKEEFWQDARWSRGQEIANKIVAANNAILTDYLQEFPQEKPALLRRFYDLNPREFKRKKDYHLVQIIGELKNPESYLPSDRTYLMGSMKKKLEAFVLKADDILLDSRQEFRKEILDAASIATTSTLAVDLFDPKIFEDELTKYNAKEYEFEIRDLEFMSLVGLDELEEMLEAVYPGYFSEVTIFENSAVVYYVWDVRPLGEQTFEEMLPQVRKTYRIHNIDAIMDKRTKEAQSWGNVKWAF